MAERLDDNPLTAQIPGFSHRKIRLGPTFHTVSLLFATFSRWLAPQRLTGVDADPFQGHCQVKYNSRVLEAKSVGTRT